MWEDTKGLIDVSVEGALGMLVAFASFPDRAAAKCCKRGGRLVLLEAAAAMSMMSLAVAQSRRLGGVVVGGLFDTAWLRTPELDGSDARVVVGFLVGR